MSPSGVVTNGVNGNGMSAFTRLVAVAGVSGVIAMYLVWFVTNWVTSDLRAHAEESRTQMAAIATNLWIICRNTAPPSERSECRK